MATVAALIADQETAIDALMAQAGTFLDQLNLAVQIELPSINVDHIPVDPEFVAIDSGYSDRSSAEPFSGDPPAPPNSVEFSDADVIPVDFAGDAPTLSNVNIPLTGLPNAPNMAPSFQSPDIPTAPVVSLPAIPTFAALALPVSPSIEMPQFMGTTPVDDLLIPTTQFEFYEATYVSTLLDPLKVKLLDNLVNGGYGIETADEVALFNRVRDREVEAMLSRIEDAGRTMAVRGFPLPPGELSIYVDRAYQDMQDKVSSASRDIMLERSKLFVDNRQFTIREVKELEQITLGFHNSVQERALNVARYTVELSIAIYNTLLSRFNARLDAYKAEAYVFAERIRGELARVELFKAEVEAVGAEAQIQRTQVETYLAALKSVELEVSIFRIRMEAANIQAGIERVRLEAYRAQVETYTAQVQAKVAEFGLFRAQVDGNRALVDVFDAQVRTYASQVAVSKAKADIQLANAQGKMEAARINLANYQGQVTQFDASVRTVNDSARLNLEAYRANVDGDRSRNEVNIAQANLNERAYTSAWQTNTANLNTAVENSRIKLLAEVEELKARIEAAKFGGEKYFTLLTAIESTINTLAVQSITE